MSRRVATSSIGIDFSAAVAAGSAGCSYAFGEMPASLPGGVAVAMRPTVTEVGAAVGLLRRDLDDRSATWCARMRPVRVHVVLPSVLADAARGVLDAAGVEAALHEPTRPLRAAEAAAADADAVALIGPYRSADVAEAVEATAPRGLALLAPGATRAGVTRDDEPGCDDPARHRGTVLRLVARDTVVAARVAARVR